MKNTEEYKQNRRGRKLKKCEFYLEEIHGYEEVDSKLPLDQNERWEIIKKFYRDRICVKNDQISQIEIETQDQGVHNEQWIFQRKKRITASNVGAIIKMTNRRNIRKFVLSMYKTKNLNNNKSIQWGINNEIHAKEQYEKKYKLKIENSGFVIDSDYPCIGCSPDGLVNDSLKQIKYGIEIKCPDSAKNMIEKDLKNNKGFYMQWLDSENCWKLNKNHNY